MKSRELFALTFILLLGIVPVVPYGIAKTSGYSERLAIYTAGSSALWYITLNGINASVPALTQIEKAIGGLTSYNLTAIKTTGWDSDFQVFGPQGYNLIRLPFIPDQGLFLTIKASDPSAAASAASAFDAYLAAAFIPLSNSSGTYNYFSPVSFSLVVTGTLLRLLPQSAGGFASLIKSAQFIVLASPIVILSGQRTNGVFYHTLTVESIKSSALVGGSLQLLTLFGSTPSSIEASKLAGSSTIYLRSLDGLVSSTDKATVPNNNKANFSGSYTYNLGQTSKVAKLNITILQSPAVVVGTRILDRGALNPGDVLSVTLSVKNLASVPILSFAVNDSWWKKYQNFFTLSSGNSSFTIPSVRQGQPESRTYVLKVNSAAKGEVLIPSLIGRYSYQIGGTLYNGTSVFNQAEVVIGMVEAAPSISVQPSGASGNPLGTPENFTVTVSNNGNGPALNVKVANSTNPSLAQGSQPWVVSVSVGFSGILRTNISRFFTVSWQTPDGRTLSLQSNLATLFFSHSSMQIGFGRVVVDGTISPLASSSMNVTLSYTISNMGHAKVDSLLGLQPIPGGITCAKPSSANVTCSNGVVTMRYTNLPVSGTRQASVSFLVSQRNLVFMPASFVVATGGFSFNGASGGFPVPAGLVVSKTFNPNPLFQGMGPTVTVTASNTGALSFYNATVFSPRDSFDRFPSPAPVTQKFFNELKPGISSTFNYSVIADKSAAGTLRMAGVAVQLFFGGSLFDFSLPQGNVTVYRLLEASLTTTPRSPVEGSNFVAHVSISNPSPTRVSDVHFVLQLPSGLRVVSLANASVAGGAVTVDIAGLGGGGRYSADVTLTASSGSSFTLAQGALTFSFGGQQLNGVLSSQTVTVNEDVLTRYAFPIVIALLAVLAAAVVIRRRVSPTAPSSPR